MEPRINPWQSAVQVQIWTISMSTKREIKESIENLKESIRDAKRLTEELTKQDQSNGGVA